MLGTRASQEQYQAVKAAVPEVLYDSLGRTLKLQYEKPQLTGEVAVCTAGTSDIPVAEEAAQTAEFFGTYVNRIYDVGVAGIHRLLEKTEEIRRATMDLEPGIWRRRSIGWESREVEDERNHFGIFSGEHPLFHCRLHLWNRRRGDYQAGAGRGGNYECVKHQFSVRLHCAGDVHRIGL